MPYNNVRHSQSIFHWSKSEKMNICQIFGFSYIKSGWVLFEHIQASDSWNIWSLLHFDQDLIGILDFQNSSPLILKAD
jgi:hypothetical protein